MNPFKTAREMKGFTKKYVALTLKISTQAILYWESGERKPSYPVLLRLADLYGTTTDYLLGRESIQKPGVLTPEERKLIYEYRELSREGREYVNKSMFMASCVYGEKQSTENDSEK